MSSLDLIPAVAVAASSNTASPAVSARYSHVRTLDLIQPLLADGWVIRKQTVARSSVVAPEHRAHEIRLGFRDDKYAVGEFVREIVVGNAADGCHALPISAGLTRLVCMNGLTVGTPGFSIRVRHVGRDLQSRVLAAAREIAAKTEQLPEIVARWQNVTLGHAERVEFNRRAAALRWDAPNLTVDMAWAGFGAPQRQEDAGADLWRTFNRAQESLIRGGVTIYRQQPMIGREIVAQRARAVSSIDTAARINADLWRIAEEFAN